MKKVLKRKPQPVLARTYRLREKLINFVMKEAYDQGLSQTKYIEQLIVGAMATKEGKK
jgi:hypothetical protein